MKLRIPIVPVALGGLVLSGAGAWWATRPTVADHTGRRDAVQLHELPDEDEELMEGLLVGLALFAAQPEGVDLDFGYEVAQQARYHLGVPPRGFRDDCSGFVSGVMTNVGVPMDGTVASIYDLAVVHDRLHWREVPLVGDIVFFDNTTDRNHNGEWDDPSTHIGLVIDVEPDGTAVFAHSGTSRGRVIGRMNLTSPSVRKDADGSVVNSVLRSYSDGDPASAGYTAAELFSAFATVDRDLDWFSEPPPPEAWP